MSTRGIPPTSPADGAAPITGEVKAPAAADKSPAVTAAEPEVTPEVRSSASHEVTSPMELATRGGTPALIVLGAFAAAGKNVTLATALAAGRG